MSGQGYMQKMLWACLVSEPVSLSPIDLYGCCLADHHSTLALLTATSLATVRLS